MSLNACNGEWWYAGLGTLLLPTNAPSLVDQFLRQLYAGQLYELKFKSWLGRAVRNVASFEVVDRTNYSIPDIQSAPWELAWLGWQLEQSSHRGQWTDISLWLYSFNAVQSQIENIKISQRNKSGRLHHSIEKKGYALLRQTSM